MEDNKTTISFVEFLDDVEANYEPTATIHWHGHDITVKKKLDLADVLGFVSDAVEACYASVADDPESAQVYMPELEHYAIDYMTVAYYTNIDLSDSEGDVFNFIRHSDILERIEEVIDTQQYFFIRNAVKDKINFINRSNIAEMNREFKSFNDALQEFGPLLAGITEAFDADEMKEIMNTLSKIQDDNTLRDLAKETMKSQNPEVISFTEVIEDGGGDI